MDCVLFYMMRVGFMVINIDEAFDPFIRSDLPSQRSTK